MLIQTRKNERKNHERRVRDRRLIDFKFGSAKWIEQVKLNYVAWPKTDRRQFARRDGERRDEGQEKNQSGSFHHDYSSDLLSAEEKLYFDQLFMNNAEKQ